MIHLRLIVPTGRTDAVCALLRDEPAVVHLAVFPGAARRPDGDLVLCDVAREGANQIFDQLLALGVRTDGAIVAQRVDLVLSDTADRAEQVAVGEAEDAVVWAELDQVTADGARLSWAFLTYLALATQIAAIGALLDSPILIVGAMVLGPEFGPVAAISFGILFRDWARVRGAVRTLAAGFAFAVAVTFGFAAVSRAIGWIHAGMLDDRPLTDFIVSPDKYSVIVAVLAGIAGTLALTSGRSTTLVGVFISVTTVPAAGNLADALALDRWDEVKGSCLQLGLNLTGMVAAGVATLLVQRAVWSRYGVRRPAWRS